MRSIKLYWLLALITIIASCKPDPVEPTGSGTYNPTPYTWNLPWNIAPPAPSIDNPMTVEGIELGRHLFYEEMLSRTNTISCSSCHDQSCAFTDCGKALSAGVDGLIGRRNSMSLVNLAWNTSFNWDGGPKSLPMQHLIPVTDPVEMDETWGNVVNKLSADDDYPSMFYEAFGTTQITKEQTTKAIAQFIKTIVSYNSKSDSARYTGLRFTNEEADGKFLFEDEDIPLGAGCAVHCHTAAKSFHDDDFHDNGLDPYCGTGFPDKGRGEHTGIIEHNGQFRTPTLRNIALTGPYMHDGRFNTLEEVIEFYNSGVNQKSCLDPLLNHHSTVSLNLSAKDKSDILAYMNTFTDYVLLNNPDYSDPNP